MSRSPSPPPTGRSRRRRSELARRYLAGESVRELAAAYGRSTDTIYRRLKADRIEQCALTRPDPAAQPRLERTRAGLLEQLDEAREHRWLGEIERLAHILAAIDSKLGDLDRTRRRITLVADPVQASRPNLARVGPEM